MIEAVHHFEGIVNQVLGDGIMALFGAPIAHEDHAVRASYAALRMRAMPCAATPSTRDLMPRCRSASDSTPGEVVVRSVGNDLHMDYSAVGQTTHLAARMEQAATPGTILATVHTLRLIEGYVSARPLGPIPVKGLMATVEAYELEDRSPVRSRFQVSVTRGLTRFVGREAEMGQLRSLAARVGQGDGQLVALVGEPGIGKSRLARELAGSEDLRGWMVLASGTGGVRGEHAVPARRWFGQGLPRPRRPRQPRASPQERQGPPGGFRYGLAGRAGAPAGAPGRARG